MQANKPEKVFYYKDNTPGLSVLYFIILIFISVLAIWSAGEGGCFNPIFTILIVLLLLLIYKRYQRIRVKNNPYVSFEQDRLSIDERTIPFDTIETVGIPYEQYLIEVKLQGGEIVTIRLRDLGIHDVDDIKRRFVELGKEQVLHIDAPEPLQEGDPQVGELRTRTVKQVLLMKLRSMWSDNWAFIASAIIVAILGDHPKTTFHFILFWGIIITFLSFLIGVIQRKYKLMDKNESSLFTFAVVLASFRADLIRSFDLMTVVYTMLYILGASILMWGAGKVGATAGKVIRKDVTN